MEQMQELEKLTPAEKMKLAWKLYDEAIHELPMPEKGAEIALTEADIADALNESTTPPAETTGGIWLGTTDEKEITAFAADGGNICFKDAQEVKRFCNNAHMLLKIIHAV